MITELNTKHIYIGLIRDFNSEFYNDYINENNFIASIYTYLENKEDINYYGDSYKIKSILRVGNMFYSTCDMRYLYDNEIMEIFSLTEIFPSDVIYSIDEFGNINFEGETHKYIEAYMEKYFTKKYCVKYNKQ